VGGKEGSLLVLVLFLVVLDLAHSTMEALNGIYDLFLKMELCK
jgi:hypothetical protein